MKSKWKATKRKENLESTAATATTSTTGADDDDEEWTGIPELTPALPVTSTRKETQSTPVVKPSHDPDPKDALRTLAQQAYSPSSLHTYKSDPLHRRRAQAKTAIVGRPAPTSSGRGGRGQPNMKLRMNVMLEKIKRDFA